MEFPETGHLSEKSIMDAVIDEAGVDREVRLHLLQCPACRAEKAALAGRLARFGQVARDRMPTARRKPHLESGRSKTAGHAWRFRPTFGMGLAVASLLLLVMTPFVFKQSRQPSLDKVYQEMLRDEKFMTEIEKLEENPLPKFYVDISDPSDQEGPEQLMDNRNTAQDGKLS